MKKIFYTATIPLLVFFLLSSMNSKDSEWEYLFNGKDLNGWTSLQGTANFMVDNGEIIGISKLNSLSTYLVTNEKFNDFILEFEVYVSPGLNSGVQFRSLVYGDDHPRAGQVYGYQCELDTSEFRSWSGGIYDQSRRDLFLYPLTRNEEGRNAFKNGFWNRIRVEAIGDNIKTWVNGIHCSNLIDKTSKNGFIGLQIHSIQSKRDEGKVIRWRNIKILEKNLNDNRLKDSPNAIVINNIDNYLSPNEISKGWRFLWDGISTNGWRGAKIEDFPENGWEIKDSILTVLSSDGKESQNGGDIVTVKKFSDFELELDFMISKGANSGIKYFVDTELYKGLGSSIGLEYQILDDRAHMDSNKKFKTLEYNPNSKKWEDFKKGTKKNRKVASLYDLIEAENLNEQRGKREVKPNTWHRARIIVKGGHVEHWLDNIKMLEFNRLSQTFKALVEYSKYSKWPGFGTISEGHILLQDHGDKVSFKNIKVREF